MKEFEKLRDTLLTVIERLDSSDFTGLNEALSNFIKQATGHLSRSGLEKILEKVIPANFQKETYEKNPENFDHLIIQAIDYYQKTEGLSDDEVVENAEKLEYLNAIFERVIGKKINAIMEKQDQALTLNVRDIFNSNEEKLRNKISALKDNLLPEDYLLLKLAVKAANNAALSEEFQRISEKFATNYTESKVLDELGKIDKNSQLTTIEKAQKIDALIAAYDYLKRDVQKTAIAQPVIKKHSELSAKYRDQIVQELRAEAESLLAYVNVDELQREVLSGVTDVSLSQAAQKFENNRVFIAAGVVQTIQASGDFDAAVLSTKRWIEVAAAAYQSGDFYTAEAVLAGLNKSILKPYVDAVIEDKNSPHAKLKGQLDTVFKSDKNIQAAEAIADEADYSIPVMAQKFSEMRLLYEANKPKKDNVDKRPLLLEPYFKELRDKQAKFEGASHTAIRATFGNIMDHNLSENEEKGYQSLIVVNQSKKSTSIFDLQANEDEKSEMSRMQTHLAKKLAKIDSSVTQAIAEVDDRSAQVYNQYLRENNGVSSGFSETQDYKNELFASHSASLIDDLREAVKKLPANNDKLRELQSELFADVTRLELNQNPKEIIDSLIRNLREYHENSGSYDAKLVGNAARIATALQMLHAEGVENLDLQAIENPEDLASVITSALEKIEDKALRDSLISSLGVRPGDDLPQASQIKEFVNLINNKTRELGRGLSFEEYNVLQNEYGHELTRRGQHIDVVSMGQIFALVSYAFPEREGPAEEKSVTESESKSRKRAREFISESVGKVKEAVSNKRSRLAADVRNMTVNAEAISHKPLSVIAEEIIENPEIANDFFKKTEKNIRSALGRNYREEFAKSVNLIREMIKEGNDVLIKAIISNNLLDTRHLHPQDKIYLENDLRKRFEEEPELLIEIINSASPKVLAGIEDHNLLENSSEEIKQLFLEKKLSYDYVVTDTERVDETTEEEVMAQKTSSGTNKKEIPKKESEFEINQQLGKLKMLSGRSEPLREEFTRALEGLFKNNPGSKLPLLEKLIADSSGVHENILNVLKYKDLRNAAIPEWVVAHLEDKYLNSPRYSEAVELGQAAPKVQSNKKVDRVWEAQLNDIQEMGENYQDKQLAEELNNFLRDKSLEKIKLIEKLMDDSPKFRETLGMVLKFDFLSHALDDLGIVWMEKLKGYPVAAESDMEEPKTEPTAQPKEEPIEVSAEPKMTDEEKAEMERLAEVRFQERGKKYGMIAEKATAETSSPVVKKRKLPDLPVENPKPAAEKQDVEGDERYRNMQMRKAQKEGKNISTEEDPYKDFDYMNTEYAVDEIVDAVLKKPEKAEEILNGEVTKRMLFEHIDGLKRILQGAPDKTQMIQLIIKVGMIEQYEKIVAENITDMVARNPKHAEIVFKNKDNQRMLVNNPEFIEKMINADNRQILAALKESGLMNRPEIKTHLKQAFNQKLEASAGVREVRVATKENQNIRNDNNKVDKAKARLSVHESRRSGPTPRALK